MSGPQSTHGQGPGLTRGPLTPRLSDVGDTVEGIVLAWNRPGQIISRWHGGGRSYARLPGCLRLAPVGADGLRAKGAETHLEPDPPVDGDLSKLLDAARLRRGDRVRITVTGDNIFKSRWDNETPFVIRSPKFDVDVARRNRRFRRFRQKRQRA